MLTLLALEIASSLKFNSSGSFRLCHRDLRAFSTLASYDDLGRWSPRMMQWT
jgi:hypothetical protein